jgi:hypothetical protein
MKNIQQLATSKDMRSEFFCLKNNLLDKLQKDHDTIFFKRNERI